MWLWVLQSDRLLATAGSLDKSADNGKKHKNTKGLFGIIADNVVYYIVVNYECLNNNGEE